MLTKEAIKTEANLLGDKLDTMIDRKIGASYALINQYRVAIIGTNKDTFREFSTTLIADDQRFVTVRGNSGDIELTALKLDGTVVDISTDLSQVDNYKWKITNTNLQNADHVAVEYKSPTLQNRIEDVLTKVVIYEVKKSNSEAYLKVKKEVSGMVSEEFITDATFYRQIQSELSACFLN